MRNKDLGTSRDSSILLALAILAAGACAPAATLAGDRPRPTHFSGLLNDYTPPAPTVTGGPYEMHGKWSLHLSERGGTATFAADMTMQTADFANTDSTGDPTKLGPHTHHISVENGVVHDDPSDPINWTTCPIFKPAAKGGFVVTGTAYVTGNGGNPPFGNPSEVTICILGGQQDASISSPQAFVEFSNFTLTFAKGSKASAHFGLQAINGVVDRCATAWDLRSNDCRPVVVD